MVAAALSAAASCPGPRIYLSPRGRLLDQALVRELAAAPGAVLLCGRYEGVDQRVIDAADMMEVSVGDYVLSGGEVRRFMIARLLINKPKVVLLDEPMAALDPIVVQDIQKYILKLQSYGTGVIVTDHNIQNLLQVVDKCVVIGEQTIIAEGKPKEILQSAKARELYFGSYD